MINKNYIFILSSILIGLSVSYFYIRYVNVNFFILFLAISITIYILLYFLGNDNIEKFEQLINKNNKKLYNKSKMYVQEEEEHNIHHKIKEEDHEKNEPLPYHQILPDKNKNKNIIAEEDDKNIFLKKQGKNIIDSSNDKEKQININISYTNENIINNREDDEHHGNKNKINKKNVKISNNNLGNYKDNSRIKLNSDWIYGDSAWSNEPDFYVPAKNDVKNIPQKMNETINANNFRQNTRVSPVMINVPWTEYKSGDSEPEPYNLK